MEEQHLPSHQQLFAALIPPEPLPDIRTFADKISATDVVRETPSSAQHPNWRRQLLTLHVIFPSLLLPALDLLDRGLVTRVLVLKEPQKGSEGTIVASSPSPEEREVNDEQSKDHVPDNLQATDGNPWICIYTVQSAASTTSRRKRHVPQTTKVYVVHLDAWSCSCGGFALDAYSHYGVTNNSQRLQATQPGWFGNLDLDTLASLEDFPCCKHLLACLLAEKWKKSPGSPVQDRYTTKDELAGIIGGH